MTKQPIPFRGFDVNGEVRCYFHGLLPHWRQANCTYFVTYRLDDSVPDGVRRQLEYERDQWLRHRGIDSSAPDAFSLLSKSDQRLYERFMGTRLNEYLDAGYGSCVLRRAELRQIVADSLDYFHGQRVLTGDFVVMPNHVHVLMRPLPGFELEDILQSVKGFTANRINALIGGEGRFWMKESYDHIVRDYEQLDAYQRYIAGNPVKAKLPPDQFTLSTATFVPDE